MKYWANSRFHGGTGSPCSDKSFRQKKQDEIGQQREGRGEHGGFRRRPFEGDEPAETNTQQHGQKSDEREPFEPGQTLAQRRGQRSPQAQERAAERHQHQAIVVVEKITQRLGDNHRQHRTDNGEPEQKFPAAQEQALQPCAVTAGVEMRDVMRDGKGGHRWQQTQQRHQTAQRAVRVAVLARPAQVPAQHALKGQIAQPGDKTDGGENDAALQQISGA